MRRLLQTEPARLMALIHALITAAVAAGVLAADDPLVQWIVAAVGIIGDWLAGKAVRDRVSPAYSDGHPVSNRPPDGITQS